MTSVIAPVPMSMPDIAPTAMPQGAGSVFAGDSVFGALLAGLTPQSAPVSLPDMGLPATAATAPQPDVPLLPDSAAQPQEPPPLSARSTKNPGLPPASQGAPEKADPLPRQPVAEDLPPPPVTASVPNLPPRPADSARPKPDNNETKIPEYEGVGSLILTQLMPTQAEVGDEATVSQSAPKSLAVGKPSETAPVAEMPHAPNQTSEAEPGTSPPPDAPSAGSEASAPIPAPAFSEPQTATPFSAPAADATAPPIVAQLQNSAGQSRPAKAALPQPEKTDTKPADPGAQSETAPRPLEVPQPARTKPAVASQIHNPASQPQADIAPTITAEKPSRNFSEPSADAEIAPRRSEQAPTLPQAAIDNPSASSPPGLAASAAPNNSHLALSVAAAMDAPPANPFHIDEAPVQLALSTRGAALSSAAADGLAFRIAAKSAEGESSFQIRLDPPSLGRIDIQLDMDSKGNAQAQLTADRPQTLEALQRDASTLERALKEAGLDLAGGLSFSLKGDGKSGAWRDTQNFGRSRALQIAAAEAAGAAAAIPGLAWTTNASGAASARLDIKV